MQELHTITHLARLRLSAYAAAVSGDTFLEQHPCLLPEVTGQQALRAEEQMWADFRARQREGEVVRYEHLVRILGLNRVAQSALMLALAVTDDPELGAVCNALCGAPGATLGLAAAVEDYCSGRQSELQELEEAFDALENLVLLDEPSQLFDRRVMTADERLYLHLMGSDSLDRDLRAYTERFRCSTELSPLLVYQTERDILEQAFQRSRPALLQITGEAGTGKRFLLKHAAAAARVDLLFVDYSRLAQLEPAELHQHMWRIRRETLFHELCVCFHSVELPSPDRDTPLIRQCLPLLTDLALPVCVCSDEKTRLIPLLSRTIEVVSLPPLGRTERATLWRGFCETMGLDRSIDFTSVSNKYRLTAAQIKKAVLRLSLLSPENAGAVSEQELSQVCTDVLPAAAVGSLQHVRHHFTLDDIKLPEEQKRVLNSVCAHVACRSKVYDEWDMESRYAYGKTVAALFTGPPGTGKTMAAHVVANMLSLPLYTVDLSQVVDKYIGETEKKLEEIFNHAQKSNSILFFDEADAIFGKRSEVNEAKDRYANTEVSYILQRIEKYDGIVLLASNFKQNIDEAFMRRIRYVIDFTVPDEELRREIWMSCFPEKAPLIDVDFDYLARQFKLVGGEIKNIALNAAFLSAQEGCGIGMSQILYCVRQERLKLGGTMIKGDFGEYAYLLP